MKESRSDAMVGRRKGKTPVMDKGIQDLTLGTVGWFSFATGTVGLTAGQTLRVGVVNLSASDVTVLCGLWSNPTPLSLAQDSYSLGPGEAGKCEIKASDLSREIFDRSGRAQIRAFVRSSSRTVGGNLEVFDDKTGRTSIILPLQAVDHKDSDK
jgi:hypothetical protein